MNHARQEQPLFCAATRLAEFPRKLRPMVGPALQPC